MRAAVLTTSPVTRPSPCSGWAPDGDDRFPCVDPDTHPQVEIRIGFVELRDRLQDREPCPHGPLGVILVCHWSAAHGHHRVADELLDRGTVALDLLAQACMVGTDAGAHVLGVLLLGGGGKPTRSQKRTETTLRSSSAGGGGCSASGALQYPQNANPSGFSLPQLEQIATSRV
jgi:hypothetical protein